VSAYTAPGIVTDEGSPETMGAVCAMVYLFVLIVFIPWPFYKDIVVATSGGGNRDVIKELEEIETGRLLHRFPHNKLASYLSAILSLQSIVLLGIGDDVFDIRWRHKVLIPAFAVIPMLVVYFVDFGVTQMVVPLPLRPYLGELFDLGPFLFTCQSKGWNALIELQAGCTTFTWH
jgi:UDP-N-acetylglucosamine--dolichyl-phosphate N-acetylglucosaminephosphotransferase